MLKMRIRGIASALPDLRVKSEEVASWCQANVTFLEEKIGISSRRFLSTEETGLDLAELACKNLFSKYSFLDKAKIDFIIFITQNPDYRIPHSSALLQSRLDLSTDLASFDLSLGCSGYIYGLTIAKALMISEGWTDGLLVTCDPYSRIMGKSDKDTVSVFGDAATVTWISNAEGGLIGNSSLGTDGSGGHYLQVPMGGGAKPISSLWQDDHQSLDCSEYRLKMNGRAIFNFMLSRVPTSVESCLNRNNIHRDDVDYFIFHQASRFLLETLIQKMKLDSQKVPIQMSETGNTVSSSIPLVLEKLMDSQDLTDKTLLLSGFGVGLSWGSTVLRF